MTASLDDTFDSEKSTDHDFSDPDAKFKVFFMYTIGNVMSVIYRTIKLSNGCQRHTYYKSVHCCIFLVENTIHQPKTATTTVITTSLFYILPRVEILIN